MVSAESILVACVTVAVSVAWVCVIGATVMFAASGYDAARRGDWLGVVVFGLLLVMFSAVSVAGATIFAGVFLGW